MPASTDGSSTRRAQAGGQRARHHVGVEVELGGQQRRVALVALADDARRAGGAVEGLLEGGLHERALLLDDEDLVEAAGERRARSSRSSGQIIPSFRMPHAGALQLALARGRAGAAPGAGRSSALPAATMPSQASRGALDAVDRVLARVGERQLGARTEQRALQLQRRRGQQVAVRHVLVGPPVPDRPRA